MYVDMYMCLYGAIDPRKIAHLSGDGDLDLDTSLDVDDDLLDDFGWGIEINQTLVDLHFKAIPSLGTLTVRCLTGGDLEDLGWETDGTLDTEVLGSCTLDQVSGDLLEGLDLPAGQGNPDLVDLWSLAQISLLWLVVRHRSV